ncbi:MAG: class I adenylate-forming enzyme family protein [Luteolibacter sp.]
MNIVAEIRKQDHGERVAIAGESGEVSFDALFGAVDEISARLRALGCFQRGKVPRVGVIFPNGAGYMVVALAVLDAGGCFVPVPDELTKAEREALISETGLEVLVVSVEEGFELPLGLGRAEVREFEVGEVKFPVEEFDGLNPAFIRFSSGTTGASKGVVLSHESLLERITAANGGLGLSAGDKVLWTLPMAHHFAVTIVLYLYHGVTTVLETSNRPDLLFQAARESGTHLLYGSPFHFAQLAQCREAGRLPELRMAISTASALSGEVAEAFRERFELPVTQALGIIEVGLPILNKGHAEDLPEALGQPLPGYEVKVAEDGELLLKGPGMFDAYLVPWQRRAGILRDGWFCTGDLAELLEDGTVVMKGRKKSVINVGGMKVFPEEIEAVLNTHPAVARSRVFAEKHPTLGSFPCAEVILKEGEEMPPIREIRSCCMEKLASYKIPLKFSEVGSIELTASGKVKRH